MIDSESQSDILRFLSESESYRPQCESVKCIQTHGAFVYLADDHVYKIKRSVKYPYMDFSTLKKRERACRRELEVNKPQAPEIYLGVVPITREADGRLAIDGQGEVLEWAVHMRRFPQDALLADYARDNRLTDSLADSVGRAVAAYHDSLKVLNESGAANRVATVLDGLYAYMRQLSQAHPQLTSECLELGLLFDSHFSRMNALLETRGEHGSIVRGHGDLHLANIAIIDDKPVLFDALEFDEELATVDVLYDLAFLLMDLEFSGQRAKANIVLNRYVADGVRQDNYSGLAALPLFLGLRASVRSMVTFQRGVLQSGATKASSVTLGTGYLKFATSVLKPARASLIAIGGVSGTGKSTQARFLAPEFGPAPGAIHVRSDQERKRQEIVRETDRLPSESYTEAASRRVYATILEKAGAAIQAGHSVVVDATFLDPAQRFAVEHLAREFSVPFTGIWLTASAGQLHKRVAARCHDASDANEVVVDSQLKRDTGPIDWIVVDAGLDVLQTQAKLWQVLPLDVWDVSRAGA